MPSWEYKVVVVSPIESSFTRVSLTLDRRATRAPLLFALEYNSQMGIVTAIVSASGTGNDIYVPGAVACASGAHVAGVIVQCTGVALDSYTKRSSFSGDGTFDRDVPTAGFYNITGTTPCGAWAAIGLYFAPQACPARAPTTTVTVSATTTFATSSTVHGDILVSGGGSLHVTANSTIIVTGDVTVTGSLTVSDTSTLIVQG